jgi:predicted TIM-barrel fold metal-dependent hydrolase
MPGALAVEIDLGYVDVHMHLDGVQRKTMHAVDNTASADKLIAMMNRYGVRKAIVMPPPQVSNQKGGYDYTVLVDSVRKYPGRLILGGGGGMLNPLIQGTAPSKVTPEIRAEFTARAKEIVQAGAHVFGEMTALHVCMNPMHHYQASPPDHPLFFLLADLAAQYDVPIDLHMEAVREDLPTPERLLHSCDQNPAVLAATLPAFERLLEHNRKAKIVWQHIGWDNTGQMTSALLSALLKKHPNLYLAIKAVPEATRVNRIHDDQFQIRPDWLALFNSFPNRIVIGADEFARADTVKGGYRKPPFFDLTWQAIKSLPPTLRNQIGKENACRIYRL